jgi:hypothetical protein
MKGSFDNQKHRSHCEALLCFPSSSSTPQLVVLVVVVVAIMSTRALATPSKPSSRTSARAPATESVAHRRRTKAEAQHNDTKQSKQLQVTETPARRSRRIQKEAASPVPFTPPTLKRKRTAATPKTAPVKRNKPASSDDDDDDDDNEHDNQVDDDDDDDEAQAPSTLKHSISELTRTGKATTPTSSARIDDDDGDDDVDGYDDDDDDDDDEAPSKRPRLSIVSTPLTSKTPGTTTATTPTSTKSVKATSTPASATPLRSKSKLTIESTPTSAKKKATATTTGDDATTTTAAASASSTKRSKPPVIAFGFGGDDDDDDDDAPEEVSQAQAKSTSKRIAHQEQQVASMYGIDYQFSPHPTPHTTYYVLCTY